MKETKQNRGLAATSLVLGIVSLLGCTLLAGIPAIICGIMARKRARATPETHGGGGMALAGIITGSVGSTLVFLIAILAGMMLPALAKAKARAQSINCMNHMKQIGIAAQLWSNSNQDTVPPDFLTMSNELMSPNILTCPSDPGKRRMMDWSQFSPNNVTYIYSGAGLKGGAAMLQEIIVTCPIHGHIGMGDGSVQPGRGGGGG